jgi:hypothetical protein
MPDLCNSRPPPFRSSHRGVDAEDPSAERWSQCHTSCIASLSLTATCWMQTRQPKGSDELFLAATPFEVKHGHSWCATTGPGFCSRCRRLRASGPCFTLPPHPRRVTRTTCGTSIKLICNWMDTVFIRRPTLLVQPALQGETPLVYRQLYVTQCAYSTHCI